MQAVEQAETTLSPDDIRVLAALHERITTIRKQNEARMRTKEEINEIVAFWWKLQEYRTYFLRRNRRADTNEEFLSETDIQKVKRNWEDREMYWELTPRQRKQNPCSYYHAILNNKSGWSTVAHAIIKYRLPQLPQMRNNDGVQKHIQSIKTFCGDLLVWLKRFAGAALSYWETEQYGNARASSDRRTKW